MASVELALYCADQRQKSKNFVNFHYFGLQVAESYEIVGFIRCGISNQMVRPHWAFCVYAPLADGRSYSKPMK